MLKADGMNKQVYDQLNKEWKSTTRILLGEELGELKDFEGWLNEYCPKSAKRKSIISGKETTLCSDNYSPNAKFIRAEEKSESEALGINEIKDIDSIIEAVSEKWVYVGNRVLGNSSSVDSSDLVIDSKNVLNSTNISESTNISNSFLIRLGSKNIFGSGFFGKAEFVVKLFAGFNIKRVFESYSIDDSSDIYYSHACIGCSDLLFSFFQKNKRHCIGNLQLERDKYLELKKKLLAEIVLELKKSKTFPSLFNFVPDAVPQQIPSITKQKYSKELEKTDMGIIEKAFSNTFKVVFKREPENIDKYEALLSRHIIHTKSINSIFGDKIQYVDYGEVKTFSKAPKSRMVSVREGVELGKIKLKESDLVSIEKIKSAIGEIGYFTIEIFNGTYSNIIDSPLISSSSNIYKTFDVTLSTHTGITSQALNSKYIFGGDRVMNSEFAINCYNSLYLTRCFEVDSSLKCNDSMFCHNVEGLSDALFCFNVKGKRQAIGNRTLERAEYNKIKDALVEQIADEIIKNKTCRLDIFTIGGMK